MRKADHDYAAARRLRKTLSLPEGLLWRLLKGSPQGMKFRKQHPVGRFVIDFYCAQAKLGFEIDGQAHNMGDRPSRDVTRDVFLAEQGIAIQRIAARDVLTDPEGVAGAIVAMCLERAG